MISAGETMKLRVYYSKVHYGREYYGRVYCGKVYYGRYITAGYITAGMSQHVGNENGHISTPTRRNSRLILKYPGALYNLSPIDTLQTNHNLANENKCHVYIYAYMYT